MSAPVRPMENDPEIDEAPEWLQEEIRTAGKRLVLRTVDGQLAADERPLSEGGDAERMVYLYGDRFRWV